MRLKDHLFFFSMWPQPTAEDTTISVYGMLGEALHVPRMRTVGELRQTLPSPLRCDRRFHAAGQADQLMDDAPLLGVQAIFALPLAHAYPEMVALRCRAFRSRLQHGHASAAGGGGLWAEGRRITGWRGGGGLCEGAIVVPTSPLRVVGFERCLAAKAISARTLLFEVIPCAEGDAFTAFIHRLDATARTHLGGARYANLALEHSRRPNMVRFQVRVLGDALLRRMADATDAMHATHDIVLASARLTVHSLFRETGDTAHRLVSRLDAPDSARDVT